MLKNIPKHRKLLDEVRDVMRLHHYSIHTERTYCDWIKRYIRSHGMTDRQDLIDGEARIKAFLTHLAGDIHDRLFLFNDIQETGMVSIGVAQRLDSGQRRPE